MSFRIKKNLRFKDLFFFSRFYKTAVLGNQVFLRSIFDYFLNIKHFFNLLSYCLNVPIHLNFLFSLCSIENLECFCIV